MDHGGKTAADTAADEEDRPVLGLLLDAGCTKRRHCPPVQAKLTQTMVLQSLLQTTCSWLQPRKPNRLRCRGEMSQQSASNDQAGGERNVWVAPPPARAVLQGRAGCSRCSVGCSWAVAIGGCALSGRIVHCAC